MTNLTDDLNIIQALSDLPNDTDGLSAAQLKAKFDEAGNTIKTFLNDTHIPEITTALGGKAAKPAGDGTSGQYLMTNGDGTTAWSTPTGAGDMLKATYDTDNDGVVDSAESAAKVAHTLTMTVPAGTDKTFDGSADKTLGIRDLVYLGIQPISSTANDTPYNWSALGTGIAYYGTTGLLNGQPEQYGLVLNFATNASVMHQLFLGIGNNVYTRKGNGSSASNAWGSWAKLAKESDIPSALGDLSGTLAISKGGTGATSASAARTALEITPANIGAAAASHTHALTDAAITGTLAVGKGGTGRTSRTSNAILTGNGTSAINEVTTKNGAFYATQSNGTAQFGTLPVAQGGTGKATHTANAILAGDGSSAVKNIGTNSGALFATSPNGAASFGTLPIAQGGTGATSASTARTALEITPANIGAAAASDIPTSLSQLSGTLTGDKITSPAVSTAGARKIYISTSNPTGGSNGDVWIKY